MCDSCNEWSRRELIKAGALGAAALFAGCQARPDTTDNLPDAYEDHLTETRGAGPVQIDRSKIVTPSPTPPQKTEYGEIMPRSAWTNSPLRLRNGIPMDGVSRVTIHHSGDGHAFLGKSVAEVARHLQIVQQAHLQRTMIDIAYHFAIDRVGRVWQLRWLEYEGQHVRKSPNGTPNNPHNVGVVVLGDFDLQGVTVAQRDRLCAFVRLVRGKYALPARAVFMHGEIVSTSCPGTYLRPLILNSRRENQL